MARYPEGRERIYLDEAPEPAKRARRTRVCAIDRAAYTWLRQNPCIEYLEPPEAREPIRSSAGVVKLLHDWLGIGSRNTESFWALGIDVRNRPLTVAEVAKGGVAAVAISPAEVLQGLLLAGAHGAIVVHNHPSGEPAPSDEDVAFTGRIKKAAEIVGVKLLDHVIMTYRADRYFSFRDGGLL